MDSTRFLANFSKCWKYFLLKKSCNSYWPIKRLSKISGVFNVYFWNFKIKAKIRNGAPHTKNNLDIFGALLRNRNILIYIKTWANVEDNLFIFQNIKRKIKIFFYLNCYFFLNFKFRIRNSELITQNLAVRIWLNMMQS